MSTTMTATVRTGVNNSPITDVAISKEGVGAVIKDFTLPASSTNFDTNIGAVQFAKITALSINFSTDVTLKTNSSSSPAQTLTFKANVPLVWTEDMPIACPITADITEVFLTNATVATTSKIYFILKA